MDGPNSRVGKTKKRMNKQEYRMIKLYNLNKIRNKLKKLKRTELQRPVGL